MLARLRFLSGSVNRAVIAACIGCLLIMLAISFIGSLYQVVTGAALSWTYSLARLFVPWIGMLSLTVAFKSGEHIAMGMLLKALPAGMVRLTGYLSVAVIGVLALLLIWFGWLFFLNSTQYYMVSDQLQVHHRWVAACVPVTGLILLVHLVDGLRLFEHSDPDAEAAALVAGEPGRATSAD